MADLYESSESEDISSFFQNFIHSSSSPTNTKSSTAATGGFLCGVSGGGASAVVAESSYSRNFSDPMSFVPNEAKGSDEIISSVKRREFAKENLSFSREEGSEAPEMQVNRAPPRSSKRSRAAEVHNISEKRRRGINEKLKVLQNLIPNSNKTDKASMLDEAIEYLEQLQLQIQMLTTRNGFSLHPSYLLGSLQSVLVPSSELSPNEGNMLLNTNRGADTSVREQETFTQTAVGASDHTSSSQPIVTPSLTNSINTNFPSGFIPLIQNHNGLVNSLASSKDICLNDTVTFAIRHKLLLERYIC